MCIHIYHISQPSKPVSFRDAGFNANAPCGGAGMCGCAPCPCVAVRGPLIGHVCACMCTLCTYIRKMHV